MGSYIPVIKPDNPFIILWNLFIICVVFFLFFIYPIQLSFSIHSYIIDDVIDHFQVEIFLTIILGIDILMKFCTAFYKKGFLIDQKTLILQNYLNNGFFYDSLSYLPVFLNGVIRVENLDNDSYISLIIKCSMILISLKLIQVNRTMKNLEEIILLGNKRIAVFHLIKLTISIFIFSHIMACLWHAVSYYSPYEKNLLKFSNFYYTDWLSRYLRCLFITINPGKVDPQNNFELAFAFFALLATSGSIGFMISSIQNITRALNKSEEMKR